LVAASITAPASSEQPVPFTPSSSILAPTIARLFLGLPGDGTGAAAGTTPIWWAGYGEQRLVTGLVEPEMAATAPDRSPDLTATRRVAKSSEIDRLDDHTLDQKGIAVARGLHSEGALQLEVTAGTHNQVRSEPQPRTVERIVVTRPPCEARRNFARDQESRAGRTGELGPSGTGHRQLPR
jgi:hypothetical protein